MGVGGVGWDTTSVGQRLACVLTSFPKWQVHVVSAVGPALYSAFQEQERGACERSAVGFR